MSRNVEVLSARFFGANGIGENNSINTSFLCALFYPIVASYNCLSSPSTLNFTCKHFLHKLFTLLSPKMIKPLKIISFHPFHYTHHYLSSISFIHAFIAFTLPSCHATSSSRIIVSTTLTIDCCALFHVSF